MNVWTALVETDSSDTYVWVFDYEPTFDEVIRMVWQAEQAEELGWYQDTTNVTIIEQVVNTKNIKHALVVERDTHDILS